MSAEFPAVSRPPQSNSAPEGREAETEVQDSRSPKSLEDLPTPEEKVREFVEEMSDRAHMPLSTVHGREVRPECFEEERRISEYVTDDGGTEKVEEVTKREAVPVWMAVANMLEWHADYHRSTLRLEYGVEEDPTHTLLDVDLDNSWMAAYQDQERAKLKALERETCGYEACEVCETRYCSETDEHETEFVAGSFENPVVVLTGRTSSGAGRPPVDHARGIAEAWTGSTGSNGVARSLRYILDEKLGLGKSEWVRWTQGEPHPGSGENQGYHHAHDVIILDGAKAAEDVTAETFRTMIEAHVEKCEFAGAEAHDLDKSAEEWAEGEVETVSVKEVEEEIEESVASYAAAYLANEKVDLLERPPEYLMWAATMWATGTQKGIKSDSANHAIAADRCKHKHECEDQGVAHGEQVTYSAKRGYKVECVMCGSPHEVEQAETVVAAKRTAGPEIAADGGAVPERETDREEVEEDLRDRWPSARAAARVGGETAEKECGHEEPDTCPLCATETESPEHTVSGEASIPESAEAPDRESVRAGFVRAPRWRAKSIIRDGEELPATGGTTEKKPLVLPSAPTRVVSMAARDGAKAVCQTCGKWCDSPEEYVEHGCDGDVYVGWLPHTDPPAEPSRLSREEFVEAVPETLLRDGEESDQEDDRADEELVEDGPELSEEVREYMIRRPETTVAEVLGRFKLPPERAGVVEERIGKLRGEA
jgi:hypothetical protein